MEERFEEYKQPNNMTNMSKTRIDGDGTIADALNSQYDVGNSLDEDDQRY